MAVENTTDVHNVGCACTLLPCYPWAVRRAAAELVQVAGYRSRSSASLAPCSRVRLEVPSRKPEIRVWTRCSDMRYFVLPPRPAGSEGLSEEQLASLGDARLD